MGPAESMLSHLIWLTALVLCDSLSLVQRPIKWNFLKYSCADRLEGGNAWASCIDLEELMFEDLYQDLRCPTKLPFVGPIPSFRVPHHKPTIWMHIHKTAGTTICGTALENGEKIIQPFANCNWKPYDDLHPPPGTVQPSCDVRKKTFDEQQATWGQLERELREEDICMAYFSYGIIIRDPIALALSHFNYEYDKGKSTLTDYKAALECAETGGEICKQSKNDWFQFFDNWLTRHLTGQGSVGLGPGKVTTNEARHAIERLVSVFDVVTILENDAETLGILNHAYGWKMKLQHLNDRPKKIEFTAMEKARMKKLMVHDYLVYDYMKKMPAAERGARMRQRHRFSRQSFDSAT